VRIGIASGALQISAEEVIMNHFKHISADFKLATVAIAIVTALITSSAAGLMAASSDQFSQNLKILGTISYGQTIGGLAYKIPPKYRAVKFEGKKGDLIEVWVRSADGDAMAWVLDNQFKILAKDDDADNTTTNSHMSLTLPGNSNPDVNHYFVVFSEYYGANATFSVSLTGSSSSKWPLLTGRWKDDLNSQQIEITVIPSLGGKSDQDKIVAKYATRGKTCRNLDGQGNPIPFPIDFDGNYANGVVTGVIYWCNTRSDKGKTFTTGIGKGPIELKESNDGTTLKGHFDGANGTEAISFTRLP
jgi:hypothetical protein